MVVKSTNFRYGFTIIELLVVIVIVSILTTITVLAYSGFSNKATVSSIQADLTNAKKQLLSFQTTSPTNSFPTAINCTNPSSTEICIRPSNSGTSYGYGYTNGPGPSFSLTASNGSTTYQITSSTNIDSVPVIVTEGMVLNLDAANSLSYSGAGTIWTDLMGNGDSILYNGVSYDSSNGGSLIFDGINDYVDTGRDFSWNNTNSITLSVWFKTTSSIFKPIIGKGTDWEWELFQNANSIKYIYWNTSGGHTNGPITDMVNVLDLSSWRNISIVWSHIDNKTYFYTNGALINSANWVNASINANKTNTVKIGGSLYSWSGSGSYWTGQISAVHFYNRALTPSEITQNFNALRGRYGI